jgi:thiol-disulfide isomerase/thioredoxin
MNVRFASIAAALSFFAATLAFAGSIEPFHAAKFAALQAANKPVIVDVYADWCPTCKAQAPIVSALMEKPAFRDFTVLKVNFDTQKDLRRKFHVPQQSTLIVFRGKREVARSVGDTDATSIEAMLNKAS